MAVAAEHIFILAVRTPRDELILYHSLRTKTKRTTYSQKAVWGGGGICFERLISQILQEGRRLIR